MRAAGAEFTLGGREYAVGTAIVRTAENDANLQQQLGRIASAHGAEVVPIDDSYVEEGASLGSNSVRALRSPRVLLVYDSPGQTNSVGFSRYDQSSVMRSLLWLFVLRASGGRTLLTTTSSSFRVGTTQAQ